MAEKLCAQTRAEMRALDQPRNIGNHIALFVGSLANGDDSQLGLEGSERIISDFGTRRGNPGNERGLADVRISDQTHVGEDADLKAIDALFAGPAQFVLTRSLM